MKDLGALPSMNSSVAGSINERGWITVESQNGVPDPDFCCFGGLEERAVLWKHGRIHDLGTLGGDLSLGIYVNDADQVIGSRTAAAARSILVCRSSWRRKD